jgi:hypothetical protein
MLAPETVESIQELQRRWRLSMGKVIDRAVREARDREG